MSMETVTWSMCVSPAGVRDRLVAGLRETVGEPLRYGPGGFGLAIYQKRGHGPRILTGSVLVSQADWEDGSGEWLHASIDRMHRMPSYEDLRALHKAVFGSRYAYQIFAPPQRHVNLNKYVLHLWGRVDDGDDGLVLPDFGKHGTI
jgi:hypothetical protein